MRYLSIYDNFHKTIFISGCIVRAYDPTDLVKRPQNSFHTNLKYYNVGIGPINGKKDFSSDEKQSQISEIKTLSSLLKDNEESDKRISYLKMDVEGDELKSFNQWLKSGIFDKVDQFGIEMHLGNLSMQKSEIKRTFKGLLKLISTLESKYGLHLVCYNPNLCVGKSADWHRAFNSYHDLLFVKIK